MRRRHFGSLLGGAALAPFAAVPAFAGPPVDEGALGALCDRLVASGANVHSILVMRGGKFLLERYMSGSDQIQDLRLKRTVFD